MSAPRLTSLLALALFPLLSGCAGYRLGNISGKELQGVRSVYVPVCKNESFTPEIQVTVTNAILRAFDNDGTLQTSQQPGSDSQLDVVIKRVTRTPSRSVRRVGLNPITKLPETQANVLVTAEYELKIEAEVTFLNRKVGRNILEKKIVAGTTDYFVQNDQIESERQALPQAAEDLGRHIVSLITEGW
jgi:hypothetical protein